MTKATRDVSSTRMKNPQGHPASKAKKREITVEEATESARKISKRYKATLKELAKR